MVIDEIQKIPSLLDEVHRSIEEQGLKFLLTGSSARKLKSKGANLLAGRAWRADLFPLTSHEIPSLDLARYLNTGGLPRSYLSVDYNEELSAYVSTYLKEEILNESLTRNLPAFSRFLEVMALQSGEELHLEGIANDASVKAKTVGNYIEILEDTLIGFTVPSYQATRKRKAISRSKFYLFDVGVTNHLAGRVIKTVRNETFGKAFEHFIAMELKAYLSYSRKKLPLQYWRSTSQYEVDFILGDELAIEVKCSEVVSQSHLRGLIAFSEEKKVKNYCVVSFDSKIRKIGNITIYPWVKFLEKLWNGELV